MPEEEVENDQETVETQEEEQSSDAQSMLEEAKKVAEELKRANEETAKLLKEQQEMRVQTMLGGTAKAGTVAPTKEDKEIDGARNLIKGSGYEDILFPKR